MKNIKLLIFAMLVTVIVVCIYGVLGVGTITLVREKRKDFPKILGLVWWAILMIAAFAPPAE